MDIGKFKTDSTLENEGVWIEVGEGFSCRIARVGNRRYSELFTKLSNDPRIKNAQRAGSLTDAESENLMIELTAQTILLDWNGLTENGVEVPYSQVKAREFLAMKDFRALISGFAADVANFRVRQLAETSEALKKS